MTVDVKIQERLWRWHNKGERALTKTEVVTPNRCLVCEFCQLWSRKNWSDKETCFLLNRWTHPKNSGTTQTKACIVPYLHVFVWQRESGSGSRAFCPSSHAMLHLLCQPITRLDSGPEVSRTPPWGGRVQQWCASASRRTYIGRTKLYQTPDTFLRWPFVCTYTVFLSVLSSLLENSLRMVR